MNTLNKKQKLIEELKDKRYRDAFVSAHIDTGIPFQIRALRKQRDWIQKELSERTGMAQERISVAENPNYSRFNLKTLKRIASAFDVALIVRFVPISELVEWELKLSSEALEALSFKEDPYFRETKETVQQEYKTAYSQPEPPILSYVGNIQLMIGGEGQVGIPYSPQAPKTKIPNLDDYRKPRDQSKKEPESQLQKAMMGT